MRADVKSWLDNDELFYEQTAIGHKWQEKVCDMFREEGFIAYNPPIPPKSRFLNRSEETKIADRESYAKHDKDISVWIKDNPGRKFRFEVKSRDYRFTCKDDFPFPSVIVDTKDGWDRKEILPHACVMISQKTGKAFVIPIKSRHSWFILNVPDKKRKLDNVCNYACNMTYAKDMKDLYKWIRKKTTC